MVVAQQLTYPGRVEFRRAQQRNFEQVEACLFRLANGFGSNVVIPVAIPNERMNTKSGHDDSVNRLVTPRKRPPAPGGPSRSLRIETGKGLHGRRDYVIIWLTSADYLW